jgi:hypothetical protein
VNAAAAESEREREGRFGLGNDGEVGDIWVGDVVAVGDVDKALSEETDSASVDRE